MLLSMLLSMLLPMLLSMLLSMLPPMLLSMLLSRAVAPSRCSAADMETFAETLPNPVCGRQMQMPVFERFDSAPSPLAILEICTSMCDARVV